MTDARPAGPRRVIDPPGLAEAVISAAGAPSD